MTKDHYIKFWRLYQPKSLSALYLSPLRQLYPPKSPLSVFHFSHGLLLYIYKWLIMKLWLINIKTTIKQDNSVGNSTWARTNVAIMRLMKTTPSPLQPWTFKERILSTPLNCSEKDRIRFLWKKSYLQPIVSSQMGSFSLTYSLQ